MAGYDPIFPTTKGILRKLGGDEKTVKTVVYEKTEVPFYPHENNLSVAPIFDEQVNVAAVPGMVLTVHYDGSDYKCELVNVDEETIAFGNIPTGNEWNESGMPFAGMVFAEHGLANITFLVNDTAESHIIGISISTEAIVPIDPKYLPGVCLPVVELETVPTVDGAVLSEAECAQLDALGISPVVIKFSENGTVYVCIAYATSKDGIVGYMFSTATGLYIISAGEHGWEFISIANA